MLTLDSVANLPFYLLSSIRWLVGLLYLPIGPRVTGGRVLSP